MVCGDRFTQRSSVSMALNLLRYWESSGLLRPAWSGITSSVEYTCRPCWVASADDGRLARAAAGADPVDVLQPCPQRRGVGGLFVFFRSHSSPV
jgi:hypothetical protein